MHNWTYPAATDKCNASDAMQAGEYGTGANHYFSALYEAAVKLDVDVDLLMQGVGLSKKALNKPDIRIPTEKIAEFQKVIWDWLNDESMGANSRPIPSGTYYMMGRLTVQEATLGKALKLGARFYNLVFQREAITLSIKDNFVELSVTQDTSDFKHLFAEMSLLAWHRYASWLIADVLPLHETQFNYPPPSNVSEYNYLFPGPHKFDACNLSLVFPKNYLEKEVKQNQSSLKNFMKRCPLELYKQYKADYSLTTELKSLVKKGLDSGLATINYCASELNMTPRTLIRKLKDEGTSFQQIKDVIRCDKAIYLLSEKSLPINEVAERVGYSDPAVFTRAFKNWTGDSPRAFRAKLETK